MVVDHFGILIFTNDQVPARGNTEIVAIIELLRVFTLEEKFDAIWPTVSPWNETEDLSELHRAAVRATEIEVVLSHVNAFAAREQCGPLGGRAKP